jgi:CheY-like chemotaxis protein
VRILIVEDDIAILQLLQELLIFDGHEVYLATQGQEALTLVQEQPPELILLDVQMPIMDGAAFAHAYHALPGPHALIVALTAGYVAEVRPEELHAICVMAKPFDTSQLLAMLNQLGHSSTTDTLFI